MILLTGGTGFLGGHILEELRLTQQEVRVLTTGGGDWRSTVMSDLKKMGVDAVVGSMLNPRVMASALEGCNVVINAAGGLAHSAATTNRDIHVEAIKVLCEQAASNGVQRLIHISCLGAHEHSDCEYFRLKREGEQVVQQSQLYWTIFRPSYLFGDQCEYISYLLPLLKVPLVVPIIGSGLNLVQPVFAGDVAACVAQSVYMKETAYQTIDLPGPQSYSLAAIMELLCKEMNVRKLAVPLTLNAALKTLKPIERFMPRLTLSMDFVQMLISDSATSSTTIPEYFQVKGVTLEERLDNILRPENRQGG